MVGVIVDYCPRWLTQPEFEAAFRTLECSHGLAYVVVGYVLACEEACSYSGYCIFDIDIHGYAQVDAGNGAAWGYEVKRQMALSTAYVGGMEVALVAGVGEYLYVGSLTWLELQSGVEQQFAAGLYQFGKSGETFEIGLFGSVYVEILRVGGSA